MPWRILKPEKFLIKTFVWSTSWRKKPFSAKSFVEIPADILYQDELVTAFRDIHPRAPSHILIIPNKLIPTVNDVEVEDELALGRLFTVAKKSLSKKGSPKTATAWSWTATHTGSGGLSHPYAFGGWSSAWAAFDGLTSFSDVDGDESRGSIH